MTGIVIPDGGTIGSTSDTDAISISSSGAVTLSSDFVPATALSHRNRIINGNFDIWQRGTSQTSSGYGSADRWHITNSGSTKTASQQSFTNGQTDVPGNPKYYLRHVVTSVSGASNYVIAQQKIEGVETLAGKTATLSFYAKADSNKNIAIEFTQRFGTGGSPSSGVDAIGVTTHSLTTSWQKFTTTVSIPSISGKTFGTDNNDRFELLIWFDAGSDFNSRSNSLGQQSGTFDIAQVQLEEGSVATPFEHRSYGEELQRCQRYFESCRGSFRCSPTGNYIGAHGAFKVTKRASPSCVFGANGSIASSGTLQQFIVIDTEGVGMQWNSGNQNYNYNFSFTAEAEL